MNEIKVAFKVYGDYGMQLICANYIKCFYDTFQSDGVKISVFSELAEEELRSIYLGQDFVETYEVMEQYTEAYDLTFGIKHFCDPLQWEDNKLASCPKLEELVHQMLNFRRNKETKTFFDANGFCDCNIHTYAMVNGKTCFNLADIHHACDVGAEYKLQLPLMETAAQLLKDLGLAQKKFITIHRDAPVNQKYVSPVVWPVKYYEELIVSIKQKYPDHVLVQLGKQGVSLSGVDLDLTGKLGIEECKVLLKYASLHIDGDSSFVHLRKALRGGKSVVLFGASDLNFYAYPDNINLRQTTCNGFCDSLCDGWKTRCVIGRQPLCMEELLPEYVAEQLPDALE